MRHYDLSPLYRSTVGFDRLFSMLDGMSGAEAQAPGYPPYNIERTGENAYRITMAVAGFGESDLSIEVKEHALTVRGEKKTETESKAETPLPAGRDFFVPRLQAPSAVAMPSMSASLVANDVAKRCSVSPARPGVPRPGSPAQG